MGVNKKTDGRYIVGMGAPNENEYRGSQGWRDIFIQLTENGATPDSEEKLAFLRDYAIYHNGEGNAIMPPSVSVWVSNNGVTSAVNADDISLDGNTYTICGIKWDGSSWDYTNAGQSSGGGGSSLPSYTSADVGKVLTVKQAIVDENVPWIAEQSVAFSDGNAIVTVLDSLPPDITDDIVGVLTYSDGENTSTVDMVYSTSEKGFVSDNPAGIVGYNAKTGTYYIGLDIPDGTYTVSMYYVWPTPQYNEVTVVPEQTVTFSENYVLLSNADTDFFANAKTGDTIVATVNGSDYTLTANSLGEGVTFGSEPPMIAYSPVLGTAFLPAESGEYIVSAVGATPVVVAEWSFEQGGGGIEPSGTISLSVGTGGTATVSGIIKTTNITTGDVSFEEGFHVFSAGGIVGTSYAVAVPVVGNHIDYCIKITPTYQMTNVMNVTSSNMTLTRLKNQSNQNQNIWQCVTADGVTSGKLDISFGMT